MGDLNIAASARDCHPSIQYDQLYSPREKQLLAQLLADYPDAYRHVHPDAQGECYTCWEERTSARDFNRVRRPRDGVPLLNKGCRRNRKAR